MITQENIPYTADEIKAMAKTCQKYNEARERAMKELQACGSQNCDAARQIFRIFPELRESITISKVEYERLKELEKRMNILIQSFEIQKETFLYGLNLLNQKKL